MTGKVRGFYHAACGALSVAVRSGVSGTPHELNRALRFVLV